MTSGEALPGKVARLHRDDWLGNACVMHLARLSLMLADHHYSGLGVDGEGRPVAARLSYLQQDQTLFANTWRDRHGKTQFKQSLLEHLLGVAGDAGLIAPWGTFDLLALLQERAEAQDRPLADIARTFSAVAVPPSDQGWRWHPWLGITPRR